MICIGPRLITSLQVIRVGLLQSSCKMLSYLFLLSIVLPCLAQSTDDSQSYLPWLILALALTVGIILICLVGFYLLHFCKRLSDRSQLSKPREEKDGGHSGVGTMPMLPLSFSDNSLHDDSEVLAFENEASKPQEIPRGQIKILQQLGIGEYGPICDGEVQLNINVKSRTLIKVFQKGTAQDLVLFRQELESLMKLNHSKVGQLFGIVSRRPYYCLLELPVNGDLKTFLTTANTSNINLNLEQLMGLAIDVAAGMAYLESMQYIHKDVAARNCMVTQNLAVKITDYKVGRYLFRSEYAVQADGSLLPIRWMAPETLVENHFSLHSDVWSFGVLFWEILTKGEYPYCELSDGEVIKEVCYEFQRLLQPVDCTDKIYQLMLICWHSNPDQRPRMDYLHQQLESHMIRMN